MYKNILSHSLVFLILLVFVSCEDKNTKGKDFSISIMSYNLENLFDNTHDDGKNDYTYMPKHIKDSTQEVQEYCKSLRNGFYKKQCFEVDLSDEVVNAKIQNLAEVITTYNNGQGADIISFQEVENVNVLSMLVQRGLGELGYKYISLLEGPDKRGIDVGVISKYPIESHLYHNIDLAGTGNKRNITRGILESRIRIQGKTISVFSNHWPSQGNIDAARLKASEVLKNVVSQSGSDLNIALGDFNTLPDDMPHGINTNIRTIAIDVENEARNRGVKLNSKGTHWYRGTWNSLDRIFVFKDGLEKNNLEIYWDSFEIIKEDFMLGDDSYYVKDENGNRTYYDVSGVPSRFDHETLKGYSDHLPVVVKIGVLSK